MPPAFNFQNVLDIRHSKVEAIEIQLSKFEKVLLSLENRKSTLLDMKNGHLTEMEKRMQGEIDVMQLEILRSNVKTIDDCTKRVEVEINDTRKKISQTRKDLVEARQDEETLEILKEKELERFKAQMKRIENNQQDDVYISLAFKNHREGV